MVEGAWDGENSVPGASSMPRSAASRASTSVSRPQSAQTNMPALGTAGARRPPWRAPARCGAGTALPSARGGPRVRPDVGVGGHITHAQAGGQHLGVAADQDHAVQPVQHRQLHGAAGMQFAVGVVFDHHEIVALGDPQDVVGHAGGQRVAGRVVHGAVDDEELGLVLGRHAFQHGDVGAVGPARHADQPRAKCGQAAEDDEPGGVFDQHGITRFDQVARDQVQAVRHAVGGQ
ncbi:hypothetical protein G6F57_019141 [Rhizopus arrhizus]|nr:hypothetical protein G6F57_019141 [Rhizopus arrhizus]